MRDPIVRSTSGYRILMIHSEVVLSVHIDELTNNDGLHRRAYYQHAMIERDWETRSCLRKGL